MPGQEIQEIIDGIRVGTTSTRLLRTLDTRFSRYYQDAWGERSAREHQHAQCVRLRFLPTHRIPPATPPALVLAV